MSVTVSYCRSTETTTVESEQFHRQESNDSDATFTIKMGLAYMHLLFPTLIKDKQAKRNGSSCYRICGHGQMAQRQSDLETGRVAGRSTEMRMEVRAKSGLRWSFHWRS